MGARSRRSPDPGAAAPLHRGGGRRRSGCRPATRPGAGAGLRPEWSAPTFAAHGQHFALVVLDGLEPGSISDYPVDIDGEQVWPDPSRSPRTAAEPDRTLIPSEPTRLAFGSCRTSVPHDAEGNKSHGVDALRAYALHLSRTDARAPLAATSCCSSATRCTPTRPRDEMQEFIESRRDIDEPPGEELKDFEEYTHLYQLAWTDPANRWLLSTLPSAMIFDDHDIRDDWNTSQALAARRWRRPPGGTTGSSAASRRTGSTSTSATSRPTSAPRTRSGSRSWRTRAATTSSTSTTCSTRSPSGPTSSPRPTGGATPATSATSRLIVVDSRAARVLKPGPPLDPRRRRDGLARRAAARRLRPPVHRHVAAVPAGARAARPRGVQRGAGRRRLGQAGRAVRREDPRRPSTSSTGPPSRTASPRCRDGRRGGRGKRGKAPATSRSCPATCTTPT